MSKKRKQSNQPVAADDVLNYDETSNTIETLATVTTKTTAKRAKITTSAVTKTTTERSTNRLIKNKWTQPKRLKFFVNPNKVTSTVYHALEDIRNTLLCPVCSNNGNEKLFENPVTLPCSHTFCLQCIQSKETRIWTCPVAGCNTPALIPGSSTGFRYPINVHTQNLVNSFQASIDVLNNAPTGWWVKQRQSTITK